MEFIRKNWIYTLLAGIYLIINFLIIQNFGFYNDDWGFFVTNHLTKTDHVLTNMTIEIGVKRHINYPIYAILVYLGDYPKVLYTLTFLISTFLIYLKFKVFKKFLSKLNPNLNVDHYLIIIILIWYFLPFNFGGQQWITGIHVEISYLLFLAHLFFLINKKIYTGLFFLFFSFNSYENLYIIYLAYVIIFYLNNVIEKKEFKFYLIYSSLIQIFFLFYKKRESHNIEIYEVLTQSIENILRFFYSIYTSSFFYLGVFLTFISVLLIIIIIYNLFKYKNLKNKNFFVSLIILLSTIPINSTILVIGNYGYTGNGIFSRTMFGPSITFFFILLLFFSIHRKTFISIYFLLFFSISGFLNEASNWIESKKIQDQIVENKIFREIEYGRNLILFHGPCYINGVEIFNASWDLERYVRERDKKFVEANTRFIPVQNWKVFFSDLDPWYKKKVNKKFIHVHTYIYDLEYFEDIYYLDFYQKTIRQIYFQGNNFDDLNKQFDKINSRRDCHIGTNYFKLAKKIKSQLLD